MMRAWVSWIERSEDYRPICDPPNKAVLGWWRSGECLGGNTLCAYIDADSYTDIDKAVEREWPTHSDLNYIRDWRFLKIVPDDFVPSDRFPLSDWMRERINR